MERESQATRPEAAVETGDHPSFDALCAYHERRLEPAAREELQAHLAACPECVQELLELESFAQAEAGGEDLSEIESAAAWRGIQGRSDGGGVAGWWRLAAAVLALAVLGLAVWTIQRGTEVSRLNDRLAHLSAPQANVPLFDLQPGARARSADPQERRLEVPAGVGSFVLVLTPPAVSASPVAEAEVTDAEGRLVWQVGGLVADDAGSYAVLVRRPHLPAGELELTLYQGVGPERRQIGRERFVLAYR